MKYRRAFVPGGVFFFTLVTNHRLQIFTEDLAIEQLRLSVRDVMIRHPFKIQAAVILPDHLHMIWQLPEDDADYPTRWRLIKGGFTRRWKGVARMPMSASRLVKGEKGVWQRRYWEHQIRDELDWRRHVDYIHFNPVKHGLVVSPQEWKPSSFHSFVNQGYYPEDWGIENDLDIDLDWG